MIDIRFIINGGWRLYHSFDVIMLMFDCELLIWMFDDVGIARDLLS